MAARSSIATPTDPNPCTALLPKAPPVAKGSHDLAPLLARYTNGSAHLSELLRALSAPKTSPRATHGGPRVTIVLATMLGDHYDMGKNIVAAVFQAKGYHVIDLGVSVHPDRIVQAALENNADVVGVSGLIVPSLNQMIEVAKAMERVGMKIPLLVGGAATTRQNTSLKISPHYTHPVLHVLNAQRALHTLHALTTPSLTPQFLLSAKQEHQDLLLDYHPPSSLAPLPHARAHPYPITWSTYTPPTPRFLGSKTYTHIPLRLLADHIHWDPFFQIMHLRGTYPHHAYPAILSDPTVGAEARQLLEEVTAVLEDIIVNERVEARGLVWFGRAGSVGDDVRVLDSKGDGEVGTLYGLRQQTIRDGGDGDEGKQRFLCISDFVAPLDSRVEDHVGGMVVSAGFGLQEVVDSCGGDVFKILLVKAAVECLTGSLAELVHDHVKHVLWHSGETGVSVGENLCLEDGLEVRKAGRKASGIRLAPCFPQQPDHTEMETMWRLMEVEKHTGVKLTETLGMDPVMAVNGLLFSHPEATCFAVGRVGEDQVEEYAGRRGVGREDVEKWLSLNQ
ncbi:hypothetical protein HDU98_003027 [Podochytrium sp. JEL0797]|nr:hypothetical protein HDU98_003027 [Podochytrium sp. JEL0797]